ncbi:MAG: hypothetical protein KC431_21510, partial [Myxococcales bacterium]|nr:hypothetical protein [Myxococcales bacterium]
MFAAGAGKKNNSGSAVRDRSREADDHHDDGPRRVLRRATVTALAAALLSFACARTDPGTEGATVTNPAGNADANQSGSADEDPRDPTVSPLRADQGPPPILLVSDPATLIALENEHGLSLAALLHSNVKATAPGDYGDGPIAAIRHSLKQTLQAAAAEDPKHTGVGLRWVHRQFDLRWLDADDTRFELIGVVNRMDRQVFAGSRGADRVGETRLIYRLAYTRDQAGVVVDSRLPMTINVVFWQPQASAPVGADVDPRRLVQQRWQADPTLSATELATWLRAPGHALDPALLRPELLEAVEIDVQTERWPATIRPDMAGHAEYLLQVLRPDPKSPGGLAPAPLENTPDVARLKRDATARAELLAWLQAPEQRQALDQGTLVVPERFLARAALSVTPRGFARLANRPYAQLFSSEDFADYDFGDLQQVRSPAALLRRLDGLSCQGCHESRSIAGFHLLGAERDPNKKVDALAEFMSPHLQGELERRRSWQTAVQLGETTSEVRQLSEHERARGAWGSHCGLGDPGFSDWVCNEGLICVDLGDDELGTCLDPGRGKSGAVCEVGTVKASADHHRDRVRELAAADQPPCVGTA